VSAVVTVDNLEVVGRNEAAIVSGVSFAIAEGEVLALIGESGSGKSTIALALMGYARPGCRIGGGHVSIEGEEILSLPPAGRAGLRGRRVAYVAQSAAAAFNPAKRLLSQVIESAQIHHTMSAADAKARAVSLFASLSLPDPEHIGERFPHQVSGGQLQRLMLAMALINDPAVIILDEPTTALDVTTQIDVMTAFRNVVRERRTTALYVSHDLAVVAQVADRIIVLRRGEIQETGVTATLLAEPRHDYTRSLIEAADPAARMAPVAARPTAPADRLLRLRGISAGYGALDRSGKPAATVLHDINLEIASGSAVGVIGESGSGKSTLARVIAGLLPAASGTIELDGRRLAPRNQDRTSGDLREIQIVFQMADTALNPAHSVGRILGRPAAHFDGLSGDALATRVRELLDMVQLPATLAERRPHELSGGQKQRVNLARALAANPKLILCDEVTSSLDTVVGAAILKLLADLRRRLGVSYLFISHDLSTVRAVCDEVVVLYAGRRVQTTPREALKSSPIHPYFDLLVASIPELRVGWLDELAARRAAAGSANPSRPASSGCAFFGRCGLAIANTCDQRPPPEFRLSSGAVIACHRSEQDLLAAQHAVAGGPSEEHWRSS
jgi:peptide/nickel transport system ATP-binding protein